MSLVTASEEDYSPALNCIVGNSDTTCSVKQASIDSVIVCKSPWAGPSSRDGARPVSHITSVSMQACRESGCLGTQPKVGGMLHRRLNMATSPIANKYREGKLKSTLKRERNSAWNRSEVSRWTLEGCMIEVIQLSARHHYCWMRP